ncbi:MAG: hypothetical protein V1754_04000, partial [Pseudomonadota bacterium]
VSSQSEVAYPLSEIAAKNMVDKMHRIFRDAIIRVITKTMTVLASEKIGEAAGGGNREAGELVGFLAKTATSVTMQATEEADKRAWTTLPARIEVARAIVPPGTHDVMLSLPNGRTISIPGVTVAAGKRTFLTHRTVP